ncbi:hypothetical protein [Methylobacterium haplocladii]|uniref:Uncharacterized protein n=1 Tax=Methylobacterium haplocladii TaxID=1176176 RepID=A0A512IPM9_9HYPH|nr:hypothetical protein [Methylobacterium haplocladii]GEO99598.1 hypothetical protein MHA02_19860 [Methylobacterium haplocladii]GJD85889.1 hypothetical protein HPGCJGGD_3784 [Methylobacterium haplocladii]GLS58574.1 hypothetical protein GCM10007887_12380 [Methylobacterium haplocladii]
MPRLPPSTIRLLGATGLLSLLASSAFAQGTPRSVGECERLKNDLAYNQCLAMFGPAAKNVAGGDGSGGGGSPVTVPPPTPSAIAGMPALEEPVVDESPRRGRRGRYTRSGGRQSVSFDLNGSSRSRWHRRRR